MSNKTSEMLVQNQPRINENSPQSTKQHGFVFPPCLLSDSDAMSSKQQSSGKVTSTTRACFNVIPSASSIACYGPKLN